MNNPAPPWMTADVQSIAALAIVLLTLGIFIWRAFRAKKAGCGGGCGCPVKPNQKADSKTPGTL